MVKFLSGGQFDGTRVPVCAYWRTDRTTDADKEISEISSWSGQLPGSQGSTGNCIANAFFAKSTITCFNDGKCNQEGKCIVCSKYNYGGMRLGLSHSPPLDILRYYGRGMTEDEMKSPNMVKFPPDIASRSDSDQLPLHILMRNVQAQIAKCCRWNGGDGLPGQFFVATVRDGPDSIQVTDSQGRNVALKGLRVKHNAFSEDSTGAFFPVGTSVVAGFEDAPSFYLEPRTGLVKPGEGVIFTFAGRDRDRRITSSSSAAEQAKATAAATAQIVTNAVKAIDWACAQARQNYSTQSSFLNNATNTNDPTTIAAAQAKAKILAAAQKAACDASTAAQPLGESCLAKIKTVTSATSTADVNTASTDLVEELEKLIAQVVIGSVNAGDNDAGTACQTSNRLLEIQVRSLKYYGTDGYSKCEYFSTTDNIAAQWNTPTDGSLPCNGVRTDCKYYTGTTWKSATDEKMEVGKRVTAEQIQEIRVRSDDWSRYSDPEAEFKKRFSVPFIWAFKDYVDVQGQPTVEQMLFYKPKVLFGRDTGHDGWETIRMKKVEVSDYEDFAVETTEGRITPGSRTEHTNDPPSYPTLIDQFTTPEIARLTVTHPRKEDQPFVYRTWSPGNNKISLAGTGTPEALLYVVNKTALEQRARYHTHFGSKAFTENLPTSIPKHPSFVGLTFTELETKVAAPLREEKRVNTRSPAPLGFYETSVGRDGFWYTFQDLDLVHNFINEVYVFLIFSETQILAEAIQIDYRFLHSIISQTEFVATDFSMQSTISSETGVNSGDTVKKAKITASPQELITARGEEAKFYSGYHAWRFKDRSLTYGTQAADNDLASSNPLLSELDTLLVTESGPSTFISNVSYNVVQYRKKNVEVSTWYVINDCGYIMLVLEDKHLSRVLPLPDQTGEHKPLTNVMVNGGVVGSEIAQWALEKVSLRRSGETKTKSLVQFFRDPDGLGLPANYVIVGPGTDAADQYGRPDPKKDTIRIDYTFLRAQSTNLYGSEKIDSDGELVEEGNYEVVTTNFYNDRLRYHTNTFSFNSAGVLTAGGERDFGSGEEGENGEDDGNDSESTAEEVRPIVQDQQDYVWVFADSTGRPIGKKYTRMLVMYYNMACVNVEIFYSWVSDCTTYALVPDLYLSVGNASGTTSGAVEATTDLTKLTLGHRVANLVGDRECRNTPNCADHEFIALGPVRREFEAIYQVPAASCDAGVEVAEGATMLKAFYPSAGQVAQGKLITSNRPGSQYLRKQGPMWYPYTACERPRYRLISNGPFRTDSTELINKEGRAPGISGPDAGPWAANAGEEQSGCFEGLPPMYDEAYRGPDRVAALILDIHPSLRNCTTAYTYGNRVLRSGETRFTGYARLRGEIDVSWFAGRPGWSAGPFTNSARPKLFFEVAAKRGDFLGGSNGKQVGFRWMPLFPEREDLGGTIDLFSEDMEPQHYRLLAVSSPVGGIGEVINTTTQYTHKSLIHNRTAGRIEYPYVPYFPSFLPDASLGEEPEEREVEGEEGESTGPITTMWAWRNQEKEITRGKLAGTILKGVELYSPDYFLDNRRLEVKLRPDEKDYTLQWTPPTYKEDGKVDKNAKLQLGSGPEREIQVDFANRKFGVAFQGNTVYDTTKKMGDTPFPCSENTATDNPRMGPKCTCTGDINSERNDETPNGVDTSHLPSRFLHLDELADDGFYALYVDSTLRTPFVLDLGSSAPDKPCCMCMYYIPGIFFRLSSDYIPSESIASVARDSRTPFKYTWSRVPHGWKTQIGVDGSFGANEHRADDLLSPDTGDVFNPEVPEHRLSLDIANDNVVVFPSPRLAEERIVDETPISVYDLPADSPRLKGGAPAVDGKSRGQSEQIGLTMVFETYLRIDAVKVAFAAGVGWEVPTFKLGIVDPAYRGKSDYLTTDAYRLVGTSLRTAVDGNIPTPDITAMRSEDITDGKAKFVETLYPSYANEPFWNQYGQQFQIIFSPRGNAQSLGIVSIELAATALVDGTATTEVIHLPERKYSISTGTVPAGKNPEQYLGEQDSATVYWRTAEVGEFKGANKFRAYAWGAKINDSDASNIKRGDIQDLELLQATEFDKALDLLEDKSYQYKSFIPSDEDSWRTFLIAYGAKTPSWELSLSQTLGHVNEVTTSTGELRFGTIPARTIFNPPGHMWTWKLSEESYRDCCIGCPPSQIIDYNFLHLHDNLSVVETKRFWDELPSGFTRLIRATMVAPDPSFGQTTETGVNIDGESAGRPVLLNVSDLFDADGNQISADVLEASGIAVTDDGQLVIHDPGEN